VRRRREVGWRPTRTSRSATGRSPLRVYNRVRPADCVQRQGLAVWRHVPALDAAGKVEAGRQFRRVFGHADLAKLAVAIDPDIACNASLTPTAAPADTLFNA
jgi:hypothetical protein